MENTYNYNFVDISGKQIPDKVGIEFAKSLKDKNIYKNMHLLQAGFNPCAAVTRRWSSSFHGLPASGDTKGCLVPFEEEQLFFHADFAQNEYKVFAALAQEPAIIQAFREGRDIHRFIASKVFGKPESEITSSERNVAKRCVHGDTIIETEMGMISIEDLIKINFRGKVKSFNSKIQKFEWKSVVYGEKTIETDEYIELTLEDSNGFEYSISCTKDHEFMLDNGFWIEAQNLVSGNKLK